MRSFEPFDGPLFVQPLSTSQFWPLSFTHSVELTDRRRHSPRTVVVRSRMIGYLLVFGISLLYQVVLGADIWWIYFMEAGLLAILWTLVSRTAGLAFGIWRKGVPPEEVEARAANERLRIEHATYEAVNGPVDFWTWQGARNIVWDKPGTEEHMHSMQAILTGTVRDADDET